MSENKIDDRKIREVFETGQSIHSSTEFKPEPSRLEIAANAPEALFQHTLETAEHEGWPHEVLREALATEALAYADALIKANREFKETT